MTTPPPRETAAPTGRRARGVLSLVLLATALANLEVGLVNVALPVIAAQARVGPATIQWLATAYQLAIIGTLVLFGRLVDLYGGRRFYLGGMATFALASLLALASPDVRWLIFARGLLGLGAAMLLATGQALLALVYPGEGRGRALGLLHVAVAVGLMTGPSLGGWLVGSFNWRAIFLVPLPPALLALAWGTRSLPRGARRSREPLDLIGAVLIFATAALAVSGLTRLAQVGSGRGGLVLLVLALLAGLLFLWAERRQVAPLVDVQLLRHWPLAAGLLAAFLTFTALASNMFLVPFALQDLMGRSPAASGLLMTAVPLAIVPVAPLAGTIADHLGPRIPTTVGLTLIVGAILGMTRFRSGTGTGFTLAVLGLYGMGAGLFQAPNNSAVFGSAPARRTGVVSGVLALSRNLGQVTGVAIAGSVLAWRQRAPGSAPTTSRVLFATGLHDAFWVLAGFGLLALLVSALRGEPANERR